MVSITVNKDCSDRRGVTFPYQEQVIEAVSSIKWLFPGAKSDKYISTRTVEAIFENALKEAGVKKVVTLSFLENQGALMYINP